jgi:hypothetical protein
MPRAWLKKRLQQMGSHESPRTTKLYDRTKDEITRVRWSESASEALSGVIMGKMAGAALAGEGAAESVPSTASKIDGDALVARVLQSQGVKYLMIEFPVFGTGTTEIRNAWEQKRSKLHSIQMCGSN